MSRLAKKLSPLVCAALLVVASSVSRPPHTARRHVINKDRHGRRQERQSGFPVFASAYILEKKVWRNDWGGPKCPVLLFEGEMSYRCFTACQKYFCRPLEPPL